MSGRYDPRYARAHSPRRSLAQDPARRSLPTSIGGYPPPHEHHLHAVPYRRETIIPGPPRSSASSANTFSNGGTIKTTYKVTTDPLPHSGSRGTSRSRSSTVDSHNRPIIPMIVTAAPKHRPVIHTARPASPLKDPYRSSEEYAAIPASSQHAYHHRKRNSITMDNADMNRLTRERDGGRLPVGRGREGAVYMNSRPRSIHAGTLVRHADTIADDYGDNGYGYTNPRDVVQYDLNQTAPIHQRSRRDSFESGRRPPSITGFNDLPRSYDTRDRGPPPSTRGFDKLPGRLPSWDQGQVRMPVPPSSMAPIEPVQRPAPFDPVEPPRRNSSRNGSRVRPVSLYHDREPRRGGPRDDYYEVKDEDKRERRPQHHESYGPYDPNVEQRGSGLRPERPERPASRVEKVDRIDRPERVERPEKVERVERVERIDRPDRAERVDRSDRPEDDRPDHKGRDTVAAGLSIAGAALGANAMKNANRADRVDRDDRDDRRRSEYDEEPRRRRDRDDRDSVDLTGRDPKERRHRDEDMPPPPSGPPLPRDNVPPPRGSPPPRDKDVKERSPPAAEFIDRSRDPKERHGSRDERDSEPERRERERRRHRDETAAALTGAAVGAAASAAMDSRSEESPSPDNAGPEPRRLKRQSGTIPPAFNPKDTMDLKALKEALNSKDAAPKESAPRTPRQSTTKDSREVAEIRADLNERRPREALAPNENRQLRVVSPPREKGEVKPAKGILRAPREKFPEDPAPLREGVAPLKDAKKDGIPPDARWTKISRRLVNPEALDLGKERYEAREDFVIVLRVLSKDEVQGYAEVTQKIRGMFTSTTWSIQSTNTSQPNVKNKKRSKHKNVVVLVVNDMNAINARIEERWLVLTAARDVIEDTDVSM
jgi:hypothetical protein